MIHLIYVSKKDAREGGLTHEGTLFGVPAWFNGERDDVFVATPKFVPFHAWCFLADSLYEFASWFLPSGRQLQSPIRVKRKIQASA